MAQNRSQCRTCCKPNFVWLVSFIFSLFEFISLAFFLLALTPLLWQTILLRHFFQLFNSCSRLWWRFLHSFNYDCVNPVYIWRPFIRCFVHLSSFNCGEWPLPTKRCMMVEMSWIYDLLSDVATVEDQTALKWAHKTFYACKDIVEWVLLSCEKNTHTDLRKSLQWVEFCRLKARRSMIHSFHILLKGSGMWQTTVLHSLCWRIV